VALDRLLPGFRPKAFGPVEDPITDHVIIAGYGLNGRNLATALRGIAAPFLIVELNSQTVRNARARGEPAFYGDATREEILRGLGIERARLLVVAISDPAATRRMVRVARSLNPAVHIIARTRYLVEITELERLGANVVIPEEFETSIEIFSRVLAHYQVDPDEIDRLADEIRASHYQALRPGGEKRLALSGALGRMRRMQIERIRVPAGAPVVGRTLAETGLRSHTGALALSISRGEHEIPTPDPGTTLEEDDVLVVVGQPQQIDAARELLTGAGGDGPQAA
jgi:CPA2 family monovalent cation:H+ antiporter-2